MAVEYNKLVVATFTEANVDLRGTGAGWGANYVFHSGGLQNDITHIAHKIDNFEPGSPSASGGIWMYDDAGAAQYVIVEGGSVVAKPVANLQSVD
jgi:hypothetical protein